MGVVPPVETEGTTHGMCRRCAERLRREPLGPRPRLLIVVRNAPLAAAIGAAVTGLPGIAILPDRRQWQRRRARISVPIDRRQFDRRRGWLSQRDPWSALGVHVVPLT